MNSVISIDTRELPAIPESLQNSVIILDSEIRALRDKLYDAVFLSWQQQCLRMNPALRVLPIDPELLGRYLAETRGQLEAAAQLVAGDINNLEKTRALVGQAAELGASDIHILIRDTFTDIQVRIKGRLKVFDRLLAADGHLLERTLFQGFASSRDTSLNPGEFQNAQINGEDIHPALTSVRLVRGPAYPVDKGGGFVVARLQYRAGRQDVTAQPAFYSRLPTPAAPQEADLRLGLLGYSPAQLQQLKDMAEATSGIVLVTGPTGSGKTTLIHELLKQHAYQFPFLRQVAIEDPIEYPMHWAIQLAITNATNEQTTGDAFADRLRTALRMDPDTMLLGEIRGAGSALAAIDAAMTGHLVFSTMHTKNPYMAIDRLELMDPVKLNRRITCDDQLLLGLVAQRLLPELCPHCKASLVPDKLPSGFVSKLESWGDVTAMFQVGPGCTHCGGDGYIRRIAVGEVVKTDAEFMSQVIQEGTNAARRALRQRADFTGSILFNAMQAVLAGKVSPQDVREAAVIVPVGAET